MDAAGHVFDSYTVPEHQFADTVEALDEESVRWVWNDTSHWYPRLLERGIVVARCHDLRLCHAILKNSEWTAGSEVTEHPAWDMPAAPPSPSENTLFDDLSVADAAPAGFGEPSFGDASFGDADFRAGQRASAPVDDPDHDESLAEFRRQADAVASSDRPGQLSLLLVAESAGALAAAEMKFHGIPWQTDIHNQILNDTLGPRPQYGGRPAKMEAFVAQIRAALDNPTVNPDSQQELLKALKRAGLAVSSTSKWELREVKHPVIEPLLAYKKMSRLYTANGWNWMDTWVRDGRFHAEYVVGGVVTGRWAANGGGALQLPATVRAAVVADPGWTLVVADAAQLEPRILSAISGDLSMADAGRGTDLYQSLVDRGIVDTRDHAKVAMLGALYGSTTGRSASLMPRLAAAFPRAIGLVEEAARVGEKGGVVSTWLGRSSPAAEDTWWAESLRNSDTPEGAPRDRARQTSRSWGRFTRNFVCQGSAAEWAMCWLAGLRTRLSSMGDARGRPHLVYFLHDEVMVHTPQAYAEAVAEAVQAAAADAGRLMFGEFPVEFPVGAEIAESYADAK